MSWYLHIILLYIRICSWMCEEDSVPVWRQWLSAIFCDTCWSFNGKYYQPSSVILVGHSVVITGVYVFGRMYLQLLVEPLCGLICLSEFLSHLTGRTLKFGSLSPGWPNFNGRRFPSISDLTTFRFVITGFYIISRVNEWLLFIKCQFSNFSAISWREQINFQWEDDVISLSFIKEIK